MKQELTGWARKDDHNLWLYFRAKPSFLERLFGKKEHDVTIFGSCTLWDYWPSCEACDVFMRKDLHTVWLKIRSGLLDNLEVKESK